MNHASREVPICRGGRRQVTARRDCRKHPAFLIGTKADKRWDCLVKVGRNPLDRLRSRFVGTRLVNDDKNLAARGTKASRKDFLLSALAQS